MTLSSRRWRVAGAWAVACAALLLSGFGLRHLNRCAAAREAAAGLTYPAPTFRRADTLGQQVALFSMGGLRTLTAELLALDATEAWIERDWPRSRERWQQITTLCPHRVNYSIRAARDMAKNAVGDVRSREEYTEAEKAALERDYLDSAERFLRDGLAVNPRSARLWLELGSFYDDLSRRPQFAKAAEAYQTALTCGADRMYERWVFYNLCRIRGREREAYDCGRRLFASGEHRVPSVQCLLFVLQNKLNLPESERLSPAEIFGSAEKAKKLLRRFEHNDLRFPVTGISAYLSR